MRHSVNSQFAVQMYTDFRTDSVPGITQFLILCNKILRESMSRSYTLFYVSLFRPPRWQVTSRDVSPTVATKKSWQRNKLSVLG